VTSARDSGLELTDEVVMVAPVLAVLVAARFDDLGLIFETHEAAEAFVRRYR